MATRDSSKAIDVQKLVSGAAKLELKLLNAGVEALQVYINQAGRLSSLAGDTLREIQDDKATLADTARKLTDFGRQNVKVYAELAQRLGASFYNELDQLAGSTLKPTTSVTVAPTVATTTTIATTATATATKPVRAAAKRKSTRA